MKKIMMLCLISMFLLMTGCSTEKFQDNQVYVVDSGSENQEDRFVDWIEVVGREPFSVENEPVVLAQGEILLSRSPDEKTYYTMRAEETIIDTEVLDISNVPVIISQVDKESGLSRIVVQGIPFVTKVSWNHSGEIVAFCGGGRLSIYDSEKDRLILQQELESTIIYDFFWSPVDKNKMYIEQPDTAGGGVYYVDPQKRVELYETREKIYYKALLEKNYYYATQWRSSEENNDGDLYTVLADDERKVIKIIGQGGYKDSYLNRVLLMGNNQFGLFYIADINQVSKGFLLTEQYVYEAKFLKDGCIAYIIRPENMGSNRFQLNICDATGKLVKTMDISGSGFFLSADGRYGYISGTQQEIVDFETMTLLQQLERAATDIDQRLMETLRGASDLYCRLAFGEAVEETELERYFVDSDKLPGLAYSEMLMRLPEALPETEQRAALYYRAELDRDNSLIAVNGSTATCHLQLNGVDSQGQFINEAVSWDLILEDHRWYVAGMSIFGQEGDRQALLDTATAFLLDHQESLAIAPEGLIWRQIQYWQRDKQGLAAWLSDGQWAKLDAEPGGLVIWLSRSEDGSWIVQQVWFNGGWVYPAT